MTLPIEIRNALRLQIKNYVNNLVEQKIKPDVQASRKWKFTNAADFHYGHFVGMMTMNASAVLQKFYNRQPTLDELREITEIIEELGEPFRTYLKTLKNF